MKLWPWLIGALACVLVTASTEASAADLAAGVAATGVAASSTANNTASDSGAIVNRPELFTDDDLLLFEVDAGDQQLSDGFAAYSSRAGVFLPLGALSRMLDLSVTVDPARARADGWVVSESRTLTLDLATGQAEIGGKSITLGIADAAVHDGDIYVRTAILEQLLPITFKVDTRGLTLSIVTREPLPFQQQLAREKRRDGLAAGSGQVESELVVPSPYRMFSPPALDVNIFGATGNHSPRSTEQYELRAAGDFAFADLQVFAGSDDKGRLSNLRLLLNRKDPTGRLGPLGLTEFDLGDTFTPQMPLGARGAGGRGIMLTSAPIDQTSVFNRIDLRGELPVGYEVELYIDEVLRGSTAQPVDGRYEFLNVDLSYGLNVVRLVFYGPHGERREEVRRVNVGSGQLSKGQTVMSFGAVQQGIPTLDVIDRSNASGVTSNGDPRISAQISHGLTATTTLTAGYARYSPLINDPRNLGVVGVSSSFGGFAGTVNLAADDSGGRAAQFGLAGRPMGISVVGRYSQYSGDFRDELINDDPSLPALRRNANLQMTSNASLAGSPMPLLLTFNQTEFQNGLLRTTTSLHTSRPVGRFLVSTSIDYQANSGAGTVSTHQTFGSFDVSGLVDGSWQVRSSLSYQIAPDFRAQNLSLSADRQISERSAIRLGVSRGFGLGSSTTVQATNTWRLDASDLSFVGSYETGRKDFRLGFQVSLGFGYDPIRKAYHSVGPGAATGGGAAVQVFVDSNGDGVKQPDEPGQPGVIAEGGRGKRTSDDQGSLLVSGLGDGLPSRVRLDLSTVEDPFLSSPPTVLAIQPRPGVFAPVVFPLVTTGEVQLKITIHREGEAERGLSSLAVQLVDAKGAVAGEGRTAYDGTLLVEKLRPGAYGLRIEPGQAEKLHMKLKAPVTVTIGGGGFAGEVQAEVVLPGTPTAPIEPAPPAPPVIVETTVLAAQSPPKTIDDVIAASLANSANAPPLTIDDIIAIVAFRTPRPTGHLKAASAGSKLCGRPHCPVVRGVQASGGGQRLVQARA